MDTITQPMQCASTSTGAPVTCRTCSNAAGMSTSATSSSVQDTKAVGRPLLLRRSSTHTSRPWRWNHSAALGRRLSWVKVLPLTL